MRYRANRLSCADVPALDYPKNLGVHKEDLALCKLLRVSLQGEFEFGEGPPGKQVFDIRIENLSAMAAFPCS